MIDLIISRPRSRRAFVGEMRTLITEFFRDAFLRGVEDGGGGIVTIDELESDERQLLNSMLVVQNGYVAGFGFDLYNEVITEQIAISVRVPLWTNKGLIQFYQAGVNVGRGNRMLRWVLGATEKHCRTCLAAAEQVHRARSWRNADIMPQGDSLECGGFNCDCYFEETTDRATGRLSRIPTT